MEHVGVLGGRVIAPDGHLLDVGHGRAGLGRQLRDRPVVVQPGERGEALLGDVRGVLMAISALVLAGLPVTPMRTSSAATELRALPWAVKIAPLAESRSPRSMPLVRGRAPTSRARFTPSKILFASAPISTPASSGNAPSSSSITTPSRALSAGSISSRRSSIGRSGPSSEPLAKRNNRL